jgi:hypothetical protein
LPDGCTSQSGSDFINWVNKYLKGHREQPYKYEGLDIYGARCAMLHAFGSEANFHIKNPNAKILAYHDGGKHMFDPAVNQKLVLIGTASFINDVIIAATEFLDDCVKDEDLRRRVGERLPKVLATFPIQK